jgi:orotidine-5'-phosphate decarboxylase
MSEVAPFKNSLCVALDLNDQNEVIQIAQKLKGIAGGYKLGPRLIHRYGTQLVQEVSQIAPVFVDCKFFDITSTMVAAIEATFESGASVCTVHALSGAETLKELAKLEADLNKKRPFKILCVSILTSWNQQNLPTNFKPLKISEHVLELAKMVKDSGLNSLVCSPEEIELVKPLGLFLVTPGIRLPTDEMGDQKRIMTPQQAYEKGSNVLVVGRPILQNLSAAKEYIKK